VDCWFENCVSLEGKVWCREWNPTIPKQPSGDLRGVVIADDVVLRMLRQRIWRVLMELLGVGGWIEGNVASKHVIGFENSSRGLYPLRWRRELRGFSKGVRRHGQQYQYVLITDCCLSSHVALLLYCC
jgi:hypothetical protein